MLNESTIITQLQQAFPQSNSNIIGIGDDAAILQIDKNKAYVITKDLLLEEIHFRMRYFDAASLAHKALHVNLSDIAAMGAVPKFVLLGLSVPKGTDANWVTNFLTYFSETCKHHGVVLIGGDTTASEHGIFISITLIGEINPECIKFRHSAKPGDVICIAGNLGEARAGFIALEKNILNFDRIKKAALRPEAKVEIGYWLGGRPEVHAMIDISDGFYIDLKRLCTASHVGAEINLGALTASSELIQICNVLGVEVMEYMLSGGEDYALLFTVSSDFFKALNYAYEKKFGHELDLIGHITPSSSIVLKQHGIEQTFSYQSFSHFGENDVI